MSGTTRQISTTNARRLRRGSMYLTVLLSSTIVAVIGVSGLMAARVQHQSTANEADTLKARHCAQAGIEIGMLQLAQESRLSALSNDSWSTAQGIGDGKCSWKITYDAQGKGISDAREFRVYGLGTVGKAKRVCSVLVDVDKGDAAANLFVNAGMEDGTTDWRPLGNCDLESNYDKPHGGATDLYVKNRTSTGEGPYQYIWDAVELGTPYRCTFWVRMDKSSETIRIVERVYEGFGWRSRTIGSANVGTTWTEVSADFTLSSMMHASNAAVSIITTSSTQEFHVDDAVLIDRSVDPIYTVTPVPGTWRRELSE